MKLAELLPNIQLGDVEIFKNLALVRVFGDDVFREPVITVDEALKSQQLLISELPSGMRVNELHAKSDLEQLVFIPTGTILEGATQNRMVKHPTILVPSKVSTLQVNCTQQGQPTRSGARFTSSSTIVGATSRTGNVEQHRTWDTIYETSTSLRSISRTSDYVESIRGARASLNEYIGAISSPRENQIGYIAAVQNGSVLFYSDLFGNKNLFNRLNGMLSESVSATAASQFRNPIKIKKDSFDEFLNAAKDSDVVEEILLGVGGQTFVMDEPIAASALLYCGNLVQLSLRKDVYGTSDRSSSHSVPLTQVPDSELNLTRVLRVEDFRKRE